VSRRPPLTDATVPQTEHVLVWSWVPQFAQYIRHF
jgi:hypothetical protein